MPFLKSLVQRYPNESFAILGINTDDSKEEFLKLKEDNGVTWRSAWQGSTAGPIPTRWAIQAFPTKYLLDAKGVIRYADDELWGEESLEKAIETLLEEARAEEK